ncbi:MAG: HDIG domain-containing metalloprotein [Chloroflexota bacterium]
MPEHIPTFDEALAIFKEFNTGEGLLKHAYAVSGVMAYMARRAGEDENRWRIVGLIHDMDYEKYPEEHCKKVREILGSRGFPEEYIRAAESHGFGICTDVRPESLMEKTLYAVDELTGLVVAAALVRPSRSVSDLEAKSVMRKWKDKAFAAGVNRSVIENGAAMLGVDLTSLITDTIIGMREVKDKIGL